jgi:hypothetical protein
MQNELYQIIEAHKAHQAKQAIIGDIISYLFIAALGLPALVAIIYAFTA